MNIGDWVLSMHEGNKIIGFITELVEDQVGIFVTFPKNYDNITMPISKVWTYNETAISPDDIPSLIDLSLCFKDKVWFNELVHELSLWKPASEIKNLKSRQ